MANLPKGYTGIPSSSKGYMRFELGENRFRILSDIIEGHEGWCEINDNGQIKRKPKRFPIAVNIMDKEEVDPASVKYFWAVAVYNFATETVQVLIINQRTVLTKLDALISGRWGDPENYTILVTKEGEGLKTRYEVIAEPKIESEETTIAEIKKEFKEKGINLQALYSSDEYPYGGDPFSGPTQTTEELLNDVEKGMAKVAIEAK